MIRLIPRPISWRSARDTPVVHGGMMSSAAWQNAKAANAILPAGQVTAGPKVWTGEGDPNAALFNDWIPESKWADGISELAEVAKRVGEKVMTRQVLVKFCSNHHHPG